MSTKDTKPPSEVRVTRNGRSVKASLQSTAPKTGSAEGNVIPIEQGMKIMSGLVQRLQLASRAGLQFAGARDLYAVFGYKTKLTPEDFLSKYIRQDIASRIVDAPPTATWSNPPTIKDESMHLAWKKLARQVKIWQAMWRADRLARLNPYSILLFGFDGGGPLQSKLNPESVKDLVYVRPFGSRVITDVTFNTNSRDARFGFPEMYTIQFDEPNTKVASSGSTVVRGIKDIKVHASRVVHIVENSLEDPVFGIPIIEKVYNLLDDLLKVAGGTSETYWLTGNRGIQADVDKEMELSEADAAELSDEIEEYMHQLRRFIRTRGVDLNVLDSKTPNPQYVFEMIVSLISGTTGIPKRILLGSEAGQLASEQDRANWAERIEERRNLFCTPDMLNPTVDLLQSVGLLEEGEVEFEWPDAFIQNPLERSQTMAQTARAIGNISRQTGNKSPMQLTSREEAREILGLEGDLADEDIIEIPLDQPSFGPDSSADESTPNGDRSTPPGQTQQD